MHARPLAGRWGLRAGAGRAAGGEGAGGLTESRHQGGHSPPGLTEHGIVPTLRNRKQRMGELADAFIALPGGIGTLEELTEVWAMNQLGEIDKPLGLLDTAGFYANFLAFVDHMVETQFLPATHRHSICVDADADALLTKLRTHTRVEVPKWL